MSRWHVPTPPTNVAECELIRVALDRAAGLRDAAGVPVVMMHTVLDHGVPVGQIASDVYCATRGVAPTTLVAAPIVGADGTAALELPEIDLVEQHLGKPGVPRSSALVTVSRELQNDRLPAGVRDILDDRYAKRVLDEAALSLGVPVELLPPPAKAAALATVEQEIGTIRATAAQTRKSAADSKAAFDAALGLGKG